MKYRPRNQDKRGEDSRDFNDGFSLGHGVSVACFGVGLKAHLIPHPEEREARLEGLAQFKHKRIEAKLFHHKYRS